MKRLVDWLRTKSSFFGRDRRWISDEDERERHGEAVRERLSRSTAPQSRSVAEAAAELGVTPKTVRRRVERGELKGDYDSGGRISRVYLDSDHDTDRTRPA